MLLKLKKHVITTLVHKIYKQHREISLLKQQLKQVQREKADIYNELTESVNYQRMRYKELQEKLKNYDNVVVYA